MNKNILILGDGFIGKNLNKYFATKYNTTVSNKQNLDVTDPKSIKKYLTNKKFNYIIYAIGIKDINKCQQHPNIAYDVNSYGVQNIINHLEGSNTKFIYISTDYVFDGIEGDYSENSICNPMTVYGKSKLLGEMFSLKYNNSIVVRTSGVYGKHCLWLDSLLKSLSDNQKITCFSDVYNTPTYAINLAEMIDDLIRIDFVGIIHLSGDTKNNRYDLYSSVAIIFNKDSSLLSSGVSNGNFPKDISLDNKLYKTLTNKFPNSIVNGLNRFKNEY